jgi:hypothetical protein
MKHLQNRILTVALLISISSSVFGASTGDVKSERYHWKSVTIGAGGFVTGLQFHPLQRGLIYCRTDIGGAYRWEARGRRWVPLLDWLTLPDWNLYGVESLALDPSDPKKLYLACGTYLSPGVSNGAILRSKDQGRSFERTDMPFRMGGNQDGRSMGERLVVDPNDGRHLYFGSRMDGLWESRDGAASWRKVENFPAARLKTNTFTPDQIGVSSVVFDPHLEKKGTPSKSVYAATSDKQNPILMSTDSGRSWAAVAGQPTGFLPHQMKFSPAGLMYVTYGDGPGPNGMTGGAFYAYNPKTKAWSDLTPTKPNVGGERGFGYAGLSIDPLNPKVLCVTTLDRWSAGDDVFFSSDAGETWVGLKAQSTMDASAAPYMKWGGAQPKFGWWIGAVAVDPFNPKHVLYGTGANIWESSDVTGKSVRWTIGGTGMEETAVIDLFSPRIGPHLISGLGDIGGFTHADLERTPPGMTANPMLGNTDAIDGAENAPEMVVRVGRGERGKINGGFSLDSGLTWKPFASQPPGGDGGSIAVSCDGAAMVWAKPRSLPYYSADQGIIWAPSRFPEIHADWGGLQVLADRSVPGRFYAITGNLVFRSDDSGVSFIQMRATHFAMTSSLVRATPGKAGHLWSPTPEGLFFSKDGGDSFTKIDGVETANAVGFGKEAPGKNYPALYLIGKVSGASGAFRSDDQGKNWVKITDREHEYGTQDHITGDPRIYGRAYLGTNGRGVLYGDTIRH